VALQSTEQAGPMKILNWLFRTKQVSEALAALDELQPLFQRSFEPSLAFDEIRKRLRAYLIENPDYVRKGLETDNLRNVCLMGIVNVARHDLSSGRDHIYRGTLSMAGEGKKRVFNIAMKELEKAGVCTPEVRKLRVQELEEDIREAG
jgi:hypothetical protein